MGKWGQARIGVGLMQRLKTLEQNIETHTDEIDHRRVADLENKTEQEMMIVTFLGKVVNSD